MPRRGTDGGTLREVLRSHIYAPEDEDGPIGDETEYVSLKALPEQAPEPQPADNGFPFSMLGVRSLKNRRPASVSLLMRFQRLTVRALNTIRTWSAFGWKMTTPAVLAGLAKLHSTAASQNRDFY